MKSQFYNAIVLVVIMILCPVLSIAQPKPNGDGDGPSGNPVNGGSAPVDGGLSILLAAGALYGGNKVYQWKKNK